MRQPMGAEVVKTALKRPEFSKKRGGYTRILPLTPRAVTGRQNGPKLDESA